MYPKQIYMLLILPLIYLLGLAQVAWSQDQLKGASAEKIAVLNFKNAENLYSDFEIQSMVDALREAFIRSPFFVLTQENMLALLPNGQVLEDCVGKCEVEIGRMLGVSHVITGLIGQSIGKHQLLLRMHHSKSGRLIAQAQYRFQNIQELRNQMGTLAQKLLSHMTPMGQSRRDLIVIEINPIEIMQQLKGEINGYPFALSQLERLDQYFLLPVSPGQQELIFKSKDHLTQSQRFDFIAEKPQLLQFNFHPKSKFENHTSTKQEILEIYTKPADVDIWINGQKHKDKTVPLLDDPTTGYLRLELTRGHYLIEAQKTGFIPIQREIALYQKQSFKQTPLVFSIPKASLSIQSEPSAQFRFNHQTLQTPWQSSKLDYQPYWIEFFHAGYQSKEILVVPQIQSTKEIEVELLKSTASLALKIQYKNNQGLIDVPKATIWLDQHQIGESDDQGFAYIDQLMPGEHLLQIRHPYYLPKFHTMRLENGKTIKKTMIMDSAFAELELIIDISPYHQLFNHPQLRDHLSKQELDEIASIDILWGNVLIKEINLLDPQWRKSLKSQKIKVDILVNEGNKELLLSPKRYGLFDDYRERISLKVGNRKTIPIFFKSSYTQLNLESNPNTAQISLDDEILGKTPVKGKIKSGIYVLKVESPSYPVFHKLLIAHKNQPYQEKIDLNQRTLINAHCNPQHATLQINGKKYQQNQWIDIKHGQQLLTCQLWDIEKKLSLNMALGQQKNIELKLDENAMNWYKTKATWNQRTYQGLWISSVLLATASISSWFLGYQPALSQREEFANQWIQSITLNDQNRYAQKWQDADHATHQWHDLSVYLLLSSISSALIGTALWKYGPRF